MVRRGFRGRESIDPTPRATRAGSHLDHRSCCLPGKRAKLLQAVELPIESANINSPAEYCGSCVDIITDLQFADLLPIFRCDRVKPSGFIAKYDASIDERRCAPDRPASLVTPNEFAFIGGQRVQVAVV